MVAKPSTFSELFGVTCWWKASLPEESVHRSRDGRRVQAWPEPGHGKGDGVSEARPTWPPEK